MNKETLAIDACGEPQASVFVIVVGSVFHALADTRTTQVVCDATGIRCFPLIQRLPHEPPRAANPECALLRMSCCWRDRLVVS
jgi:hypothetical protein